MKFLGMGALEILAILVIALIVLGPERMIKTARRIGEGVRELKHAMWKAEQYLDEDKISSSPNPTKDSDDNPNVSSPVKHNPVTADEASSDEEQKHTPDSI